MFVYYVFYVMCIFWLFLARNIILTSLVADMALVADAATPLAFVEAVETGTAAIPVPTVTVADGTVFVFESLLRLCTRRGEGW